MLHVKSVAEDLCWKLLGEANQQGWHKKPNIRASYEPLSFVIVLPQYVKETNPLLKIALSLFEWHRKGPASLEL